MKILSFEEEKEKNFYCLLGAVRLSDLFKLIIYIGLYIFIIGLSKPTKAIGCDVPYCISEASYTQNLKKHCEKMKKERKRIEKQAKEKKEEIEKGIEEAKEIISAPIKLISSKRNRLRKLPIEKYPMPMPTPNEEFPRHRVPELPDSAQA